MKGKGNLLVIYAGGSVAAPPRYRPLVDPRLARRAPPPLWMALVASMTVLLIPTCIFCIFTCSLFLSGPIVVRRPAACSVVSAFRVSLTCRFAALLAFLCLPLSWLSWSPPAALSGCS